MSEEQNSVTEVPTAQLRYVKRIVRPTADKEKLMTFLQQAWVITDLQGEAPLSQYQRIEWRDVPTETEGIDGASG